MKETWKKFSKWDKTSIYVLTAMLITMVLGLILIGTISFTEKDNGNIVLSENGFSFLKNNSIFTIGNVITGSKTINGYTISLTNIFEVFKNKPTIDGVTYTITGTAAQLQAGVIFTVIITPILLSASIGIFGYSLYLKKRKK